MMPAAKHYDPVMGIDIHIIQPPGPVPPVPIPHPFVGILFDTFDYVPMLGATVYINGIPRAQAGTAGKGMPPHIPIGGTFIKPPANECEMFMGSSTVEIDGEACSYMALPVLSCQCIGIPPPPRLKKKSKTKSLVAPTSIVMPIPAGMPVLIGGPPTISLMAMGMKAGMSGLGKGLKKLRALQKGSKSMAKLSQKMRGVATKAMKKLGVPPSIQNKVRRAICTVTGHPVDVATGKVFTDKVDFALPGPIPFKWERVWYSTSAYEGPLGHGWHHCYDMALGFDFDEQAMAIRLPDGRSVGFPLLDIGEESYNRQEKLTLFRDEKGYGLRDVARLIYRFQPNTLEVTPLTSIENTAGHKIQFAYNPGGHLEKIIDSAGRILIVENDTYGRVVRIYGPHPTIPQQQFRMIRYVYDADGNLTQVYDALDHPATYAYKDHLLVQETDRNGLSFYFQYDKTGTEAQCIRTWGDGGIYDHKITYHTGDQLTIVENSLGHKTWYYCNDQGVVTSTIDARGHTSTTEYNEHNEVITETDEVGLVTAYSYDERGNYTSISGPGGSTFLLEYQNDLLVKAIDQLGGEWQWQYDEQGLLIARTDCLGRTTQYAHTNGQLTEITDPAGGKTLLGYDHYNNLYQLVTPDGAVTQCIYDALGRSLEVIDPKGNVQRRRFDLLNRMVQVLEPDENERTLAYDREGNIVRARDRHYDIRFEYAGMGRMVARIEEDTRVEFHYDTEEQLIGIKNEHGFVYKFERDPKGEVVVESGYDGVTRRYVRNAGGQIAEVVRPDGRVIRYGYDLAGRVISVKYSNESAETYNYRKDGELIEATNDAITVRFERDIMGKIVREIQGEHTVSSTYDLLGMRTGVSSSLGADVSIMRNLMGDAEKITVQNERGTWETQYKRDIMGLEIERTLPGGIRSRWQRDKLGRPIHHQITGNERTFSDKKYVWDVNDRLKQVIDVQKGITQYEHDVFGNLSAARYGDGTFEYRLPDKVGNLFRKKDYTDRKYGPAGQLLEAEGTRYFYDAEGNLVKKTESNGKTWQYAWNASGMLAEVTRPDGEKVTFTYDALGRRLSKTYKGKTTRWVWDGNNPFHEWVEHTPETHSKKTGLWESILDIIRTEQQEAQLATALANGPPEKEKITDLITWVFEPESFTPVAKLQGESRYGIVSNYLGTPESMYNENGQQVWSAELSIYGELRNLQGERSACPFRWPGQYEDEETGLNYNRFRYYDAKNGLYLSQDPIGIAGNNPTIYAYVHDPNTWIDFFGLTEIIRTMSEEEANLTSSNKGLVPGKNGSRGAKWVSQGVDPFNTAKDSNYKAVFDMDDSVDDFLKQDVIDYEDMEGGESKNTNKILKKSNEKGAIGIGVDKLEEFNSKIKSITIYKKEKGKWKKVKTIKCQ